MTERENSNFLQVLSARINSNIVVAVLYYASAFVLANSALYLAGLLRNESFQAATGRATGLGITLGIFHWFVLRPKELAPWQRALRGLAILAASAVLYSLAWKLLS